MTGISNDARHARIAWRCRRGMRELDLLLERVLAPGLGRFSDVELDCLEKLLEQPDQDILAWLTGGPGPDDAELDRIVTIARDRIDRQVNSDE